MNVARHLRSSGRVRYAVQRGPRVRYLPYAALQVELTPTCEAQFAVAHEHV